MSALFLGGDGAGTVIAADTESLPQAAADWRALLDIPLAVPQQIPSYPDPASAAAYSAMEGYVTIQNDRDAQRIAAADDLMAWVGKVSGAFTFADQSGAGTIANSSPGTMQV